MNCASKRELYGWVGRTLRFAKEPPVQRVTTVNPLTSAGDYPRSRLTRNFSIVAGQPHMHARKKLQFKATYPPLKPKFW